MLAEWNHHSSCLEDAGHAHHELSHRQSRLKHSRLARMFGYCPDETPRPCAPDFENIFFSVTKLIALDEMILPEIILTLDLFTAEKQTFTK